MLKVSQFYNKNQFLVKDKNAYYLQSYDSLVAMVKDGKITLYRYWDYSSTTRKHIYLFLSDYAWHEVGRYLSDAKNKRKVVLSLIDKGVIKCRKK